MTPDWLILKQVRFCAKLGLNVGLKRSRARITRWCQYDVGAIPAKK
jgi:hypothetical protein